MEYPNFFFTHAGALAGIREHAWSDLFWNNHYYDDQFDIPADKKEDKFNEEMVGEGFVNGDKDFTHFDKRYKVEFFDLYKNETAFFVKFGSAQKLGYVIDQSINSVKLIQNQVDDMKQNGQPLVVKNICLWLGLERKTTIEKLSDINSLIFQMKLAEWRKIVLDAGYQPLVWVNYKEVKDKRNNS